jgi:hypothetical protein
MDLDAEAESAHAASPASDKVADAPPTDYDA